MTAESFPSSFFQGAAATTQNQVDIAGSVLAAANSATAAATSATAASTSATSASTQATAAAASATTATTQATTATTQAGLAGGYATAAATSQSAASSSAFSASGYSANALTYSTNAATSATAASGSATAAASSATAAASSATSAATSASGAATSATNAATSAATSATSASTATTQAANAATSATNAVTTMSYADPAWFVDTTRPALFLDFSTEELDPRITFARAGTALRCNKSGLLESIATGLPRFDYDPATLQFKGLLIEDARTNLLLQSSAVDNASWAKVGCTITADNAALLDPMGTTLSDTLVEDTSTGNHWVVAASGTVASSTAVTISQYVRANGRTTVVLVANNANGLATGQYDLTGLTTSAVSASLGATAASATITDVGNSWRRITLTFTTGPSQTAFAAFLRLYNAGVSYTGDGVSGVHAWGAQAEIGDAATSHIPTTTTTVTRNAESAVMTGTNFTNWFNAAQQMGTFYVDAVFPARGAANRTPFALSAAGSYTNCTCMVYTTAAGSAWGFAINSGNATANFPAGYTTIDLGSTRTVLGFNKSLAVTTTTAAQPVTSAACSGTTAITNYDTMYIGGNWNGTTAMNGWVKTLTYWSRQVPSWTQTQVTNSLAAPGTPVRQASLWAAGASYPSFQVIAATAGVNYLQATNASTTVSPVLQATGTDTNIDIVLGAKGTGAIRMGVSGTQTVRVESVTSPVNYLQLYGAATGVTTKIASGGSDANPAITLLPKGTGSLLLGNAGGALGFFTSTGAVKATVSGAKASNAALASLMTALAGYGLVTDSTTA